MSALVAQHGRMMTVEVVRDLLQVQRDQLAQGKALDFDEAAFTLACARELEERTRRSLRPVINLSGTVLHTNLGRALMPQSVAEAVMTAMTRPVNLEFDLGGGARGERARAAERDRAVVGILDARGERGGSAQQQRDDEEGTSHGLFSVSCPDATSPVHELLPA